MCEEFSWCRPQRSASSGAEEGGYEIFTGKMEDIQHVLLSQLNKKFVFLPVAEDYFLGKVLIGPTWTICPHMVAREIWCSGCVTLSG